MLSRRLPAVPLLLLSITAQAAPEGRLLEARAIYLQARQAQAAGRPAEALALAGRIADYPLYPYLIATDLRRRLRQLPADEIARFLEHEDGSLLATRLRGEWLRVLAAAQRWDLYRRDYRPQDEVVLRCHDLTARMATGAAEAALADTRVLWLTGDSLPAACDAPFERLSASGLITDELVWARMRLAFANGRTSLAQYLARRLSGADLRALAARWVAAAQDPAGSLRTLDDDTPPAHDILVYALERLAARNVDQARAAWRAAELRTHFTTEETAHLAAILALRAADDGHPDALNMLDAVPPAAIDARVEHYRLREALEAGDWTALSRWTAQLPQSADEALRWRYWHAQALLRLGQDDAGRAVLGELAGERDYYGFLAADQLDRDYSFGHVPVSATPDETTAVLALPGIVRAHELHALRLDIDAHREWHFELARFTRRQLEVAATVAASWRWPDRAIFALGQARSYDDLELRFPLLHVDVAVEQARRRDLDPARVFAIIRSESAFAADARSPAGALGLMQLLPGTARETARRIGLAYAGNAMLFEPRANVTLGTAYLGQVLTRLGGSFVMAVAAYNAGPGRVRLWRGVECMAADRWIELIPFNETRSYVRRALFYTAVYEWRLGRKITRLNSMMSSIPARGVSKATDCKS